MRISRIGVALFGLLFASLGLGFWFMPDRAASGLHLAADRMAGLTSLRADMGGLFMALAILCLAGAGLKRRWPLWAAAGILAAIVLGRLIGGVADRWTAQSAVSLVIELAAIGALMVYARSLAPSREPTPGGRRGLIVAGALALAAAGVAATLMSAPVQQRLFERAAQRLVRSDNAALMQDDALRVAVCGTSAPLPSARRAKACVAVIAGGKIYVVDVGPESVENLMLWGVPLARVGGVLVTHFHSDHIGDLGELNLQTWVAGRPGPMAVYGGPGVERVVAGFNEAYALDQTYRTAHHGAQMMPAATWPLEARPVPLEGPANPAKSRTATVLQDGALKITAIEVDHSPIEPAYAYRIDYKGRSVVVSGDLKAHAPLANAAQGADVLVSEAIARPMIRTLGAAAATAGRDRVAKIMGDVQSYHISPQEAAETANQAGVKLLVFYHLLPAPDNALTRRVFARGVNQVRRGDWTMAEDGSLYTLPIGSEEVLIGRVRR